MSIRKQGVDGGLARTASVALLGALVAALLATPVIAAPAILTGSFTSPQSLAVDQGTHDVYVLDAGAGTLKRFEASGEPADFTAGAGAGTNTLTGFNFDGPSAAQVAIAPPGAGATAGDVYVVSHGGVDVYSSAGEHLGNLDGTGNTNPDTGGESCGVTVDPLGNLYVGYFSGHVDKYVPSRNPVVSTDFDSELANVGSVCSVAASTSSLYASTWSAGPLTKFPLPSFPGGGGSADATGLGTAIETAGSPVTSTAVYVNPADEDLYVDEGSQIAVLDAFGNPALFSPFAVGTLSGNSQGIAVDATTGDSYTADAGASPPVVYRYASGGVPLIVPNAITEPASELDQSTATLNGHLDPAGGPEITVCAFEYVTETAFQATGYSDLSSGGSIPCEQAPPIASEAAVTAKIASLTPSTVYHYRLKASNENGNNRGEDQTFRSTGPVVIDSTSATGVSADAADLHAQINPEGFQATCHFQYTTDPGFVTNIKTAACNPTELAAQIGDVEASAHIQDLTTETTYHYRVVAENGIGNSQAGPIHSFTTQAASVGPLLPDNRAYEMVSPLEKADGAITRLDAGGIKQASAEGNQIAYVALGSFGEPLGAPIASNYLATRTASGWVSRNLTEPQADGSYCNACSSSPYIAFSSDLSTGLMRNGYVHEQGRPALNPPLTSDALPDYQNYYLRDTVSTGLQALLTTTNTVSDPRAELLHQVTRYTLGFEGATPDLTHVIVSSNVAFTPNAGDTGGGLAEDNLYEWASGQLQLINILPGQQDGTTEARLGGAVNSNGSVGNHGVSDDGSRVVFTRPGSSNTLYLRDTNLPGSGDPQAQTTVQVDASQHGADPGGGGEFETAASDGSKLFFLDKQRLVPSSTAGGESGSTRDLYQFDAATGQLTDLSSGTSGGEPAGALGVLGASSDGAYVYFVANGVLGEAGAHGASRGDCVLHTYNTGPEVCNLYVEHDGQVTFIAELSQDDEGQFGTGATGLSESSSLAGDWSQAMDSHSSRVSGNGRRVVFMSDRSLTDYDNRDAATGQLDQEVYLYEEGSGLSCVSCNPTGERPSGFSGIPGGTKHEKADNPIYQSRVLSEDVPGGGDRIFFDSFDSLVPRDTNGALDVYEWESRGTEGCALASGCLYLISGARSSEASSFLDASVDGSNVFFVTSSRLSRTDLDGVSDVYDARVGGGFPEPPPPPACEGDSCQSPAASPEDQTPSTATFSGIGNFLPAPASSAVKHRAKQCGKGMVLERHKCARRKSKVKQRKRKSRKTTANRSKGR